MACHEPPAPSLFSSPPNCDDNDGLHHFSDDFLNTVHPFTEDLKDDNAHNNHDEDAHPRSNDEWEEDAEGQAPTAPTHDEGEDRPLFSDEHEPHWEEPARSHEAQESDSNASDDSYGKQMEEEKAKQRRRKEKERLREEAETEPTDTVPMSTYQPSIPSGRRSVEPRAPGPSCSKTKDSGRPVPKNREVTTGFDSVELKDNTSEEESSDDDTGSAVKGKGKRRAGGRPSAEALGESTRAEAAAIAEEYNLHPQTVLVRTSLVLKATKFRNILNAVCKVFTHEYCLQHNGGESK